MTKEPFEFHYGNLFASAQVNYTTPDIDRYVCITIQQSWHSLSGVTHHAKLRSVSIGEIRGNPTMDDLEQGTADIRFYKLEDKGGTLVEKPQNSLPEQCYLDPLLDILDHMEKRKISEPKEMRAFKETQAVVSAHLDQLLAE